MAKKKNLISTERTIEFYHLVQGQTNGPEFKIGDFVDELKALKETDRWLFLDSNNERFDCWYEGKGKSLHKLKIGITRSKVRDKKLNLKTAKTSSMEFDSHEEMCAECHLIIFPNNYVGFEFNPLGPRLSQLTEFIDKKFPAFGRIKFEVAADRNFQRNLEKVKRFNSISFTMSDANSALYKKAEPNYSKTLEELREKAGGGKIRVVHFADKKNKESVTDFGKRWAKKLFTLSANDPETDEAALFKQMQVKFDGPENEAAVKRSLINLTCSKITAKKEIAFATPVSSKNVDSDAAYQAIRDAYDELEGEIKKSKAVPEY